MRKKINKAQKQQGQKSQLFTVNQHEELLPFLLQVMQNRSRNSVKSILSRGQVSIDNKVETAFNYALKPGQKVEIYKNKVQSKKSFIGFSILHEDNDIIVINKESGLLSIASPKEKEMTAYRQLMEYVRSFNPKNRIFVVHRLDRDTSGVMLFAKNESTKRMLQDNWKEVVEERTYVALVEGVVRKPKGTISSWLKETKTFKMVSGPQSKDSKHAITHYKIVQANKEFTLLELQLETGRKNQIRVHMEDIGHPIVGDKKYGSKVNIIGRLGLHAKVLSFIHPTTNKVMRFETEIPGAFLKKSR